MTAIAYYLLKMLICSGILTGYYYACLQNKLFHQWNRFYLLFTVLVSVVFPLLYVPLLDFSAHTNSVGHIAYTITASELALLQRQSYSISPAEWITYSAYGLVTAFFLVMFLRSLYMIYALKKRSAFIQESDINIYQTDSSQAPFSFFRNIFWKQNINLQSAEGRQILKHELVHVYEKHSVDKVLMQVVLSVCWINPFFWLIKNELTIIHEFIADKKSVENNDASVLASLILNTAYSSNRFEVVNNFFQSPIKRRITMITKNKDPRFSYIQRLIVLPLLLLVFGLLTVRVKAQIKKEKEKAVTEKKTPKETAVVQLYPIKRETEQPLAKPKKDKPADRKPTVTISYYKADAANAKDEYELTTNGGTQEDATTALLSMMILAKDPKKFTNDPEVINAINNLKKAVDNSVKPENRQPVSIKVTDNTVKPAAEPLYIIDGVDATKADLDRLDPNDIFSMSIWKSAKAIEEFGEKGHDGVIDVVTKTKRSETLTR